MLRDLSPKTRTEMKLYFIESDLTEFLKSYDDFVWQSSSPTLDERNTKIQSLKNQLYNCLHDASMFRLSLFYMGGFRLQDDIDLAFPEFYDVMGFSANGSDE